ncbi:hypothetical protein AAFF_G00212160 [Aldrovandia affinis]|uniref:Uncharacterized protein n=1 Tax=Aldrovandia affinis TaxID=143900 RepID=A0AAD7RH49_9TELE|nr:hypothetical protein AAFF_G00212160 [Aldrovandia affinis]
MVMEERWETGALTVSAAKWAPELETIREEEEEEEEEEMKGEEEESTGTVQGESSDSEITTEQEEEECQNKRTFWPLRFWRKRPRKTPEQRRREMLSSS